MWRIAWYTNIAFWQENLQQHWNMLKIYTQKVISISVFHAENRFVLLWFYFKKQSPRAFLPLNLIILPPPPWLNYYSYFLKKKLSLALFLRLPKNHLVFIGVYNYHIVLCLCRKWKKNRFGQKEVKFIGTRSTSQVVRIKKRKPTKTTSKVSPWRTLYFYFFSAVHKSQVKYSGDALRAGIILEIRSDYNIPPQQSLWDLSLSASLRPHEKTLSFYGYQSFNYT